MKVFFMKLVQRKPKSEVEQILEEILEIKQEYLSLMGNEGSIELDNPYGSVGVHDTIATTAEFSGALDRLSIGYKIGIQFSLEGEVETWNPEQVKDQQEEINRVKNAEVAEYDRRERIFKKSTDYISKPHPRTSTERKQEKYKIALDDLTDNDFKTIFDTMPNALYGWLENIGSVLSSRTHVEGVEGLAKRVDSVLGKVGVLKGFEQYRGPLDHELAAKVYSD